MRHSVRIALGAFTSVVVLTATSPVGRQTLVAQTNWREVRALKMGRFHARIDVSSAHTVRLYSQLDTSRLTGEELPPDSVKTWQDNLFNELDKPTRMRYVLGNSILVQPFAADSTTIGYLLTVADTSGASRQVVTDKDGMEEFLDLLAKGVAAAKTLTDDELKRPGPVTQKPIELAKHVNLGSRQARVHRLHTGDVQGFRGGGNGRGENDGIHSGDARGTQDRAARPVSNRLQVKRGAAGETVRDTNAQRTAIELPECYR
jgi:hypothetical protein